MAAKTIAYRTDIINVMRGVNITAPTAVYLGAFSVLSTDGSSGGTQIVAATRQPATFSTAGSSGDGVNTIAEIIQELVTAYSPDAINLLWIYATGTAERIANSWDDDSATAPKLDITYTPAATGGKGSGGKGKGPGGGGGNNPGNPGHKGNPPGQRAANIVANSWRWRR